MFDSPSDISSDVEWALRSGQTSTQDLAQMLVDTFGKAIHRLSISLLGLGNNAYDFTIDVFAAALLNVHRFDTSPYSKITDQASTIEEKNMAIKLWLFSLAFDRLHQKRWSIPPDNSPWMETAEDKSDHDSSTTVLVWDTWESLNSTDRLVVILYYLFDCSSADISSFTRTSEKSICSFLDDFRTGVKSVLQEPISEDVQYFDDYIREILQKSLHEMEPPLPDKSYLARQATARADSLSIRRRLLVGSAEILSVLVAILVVGGLFWGYNRYVPLLEPTPTPTSQISEIAAPASQPQTLPGAGSIIKPTPTPVPKGLFYVVQPGDSLGSISREFGYVSVKELVDLNRLAPGEDLQPGFSLLIPSRLHFSPYPSATPVDATDITEPDLPEVPFGYSYSPRLYRSYRWMTNGWKTIWVDAVFTEYSNYPDHFDPTETRIQVWISNNQLLVLKGPPTGKPDEVILAQLDKQQYYSAQPDGQYAWYQDVNPRQFFSSPLTENYLTRLMNPFYPYTRRGERSFQLVRVDQLDGRDVEVLEGRNPDGWLISRLWVDRQGGLVLRNQRYSGDASEKLLVEIDVTNVTYDINFPQELFDPRLPWRGGYAQDYSGKPESISASRVLPAAAMNSGAIFLPTGVEASELTQAQFTFDFSQNSVSNLANQTAELSANGYYLGKVTVGYPGNTICDRSPDGRIFAFVGDPASSNPLSTYLNWFVPVNQDLITQKTLFKVSVQDFAFSPDSQSIAFFGSDGIQKGLFVYNLVDNKLEFLLPLIAGHSIVWNPDGQEILLIGQKPDNPTRADIILVTVKDDQGMTIQASAFMSGKISDLPGFEWGVNFPVESHSLADCARVIDISGKSSSQ
jgi:LysM repeat protein/DNA-directed RNA polymerase specialized sigma24 family protein